MLELRAALPVHEQPAEIARFIVRTTAHAAGRGPTKARAYVEDDVITAVLRDTLTKTERRLLDHGQVEAVHAARLAVQNTTRQILMDGVQRVTGRGVFSLHIDHQVQPDVMVTVFVLDDEPAP